MSRSPYIDSVHPADPYHSERREMIEVRIGYAGLKVNSIDVDYITPDEAVRLIGELASAVQVLRKRVKPASALTPLDMSKGK